MKEPATFLYKADPVRGRQWAEVFKQRAPELEFRLWPDIGDPARVRFLAAWEPPSDIATRFPNLDISLATKTGQMMCYRHLERVRARVL